MARVRLIVWNAMEARVYAAELTVMGHKVAEEVPRPGIWLRELRAAPPDIIVIHLGRLPSQGRDVAFGIRASKKLRSIPVLFAGGEPEKVAMVREKLPDAPYCSWEDVGTAIDQTMEQARQSTAPPPRAASALEAYRSTPLLKKLGIRKGLRIALYDPPASFLKATGLTGEEVSDPDLIICFVNSVDDLLRRVPEMSRLPGLWIGWPKRTAVGLTALTIREIAATAGLVDYKVCSINPRWSAMRFTRRKKPKA